METPDSFAHRPAPLPNEMLFHVIPFAGYVSHAHRTRHGITL